MTTPCRPRVAITLIAAILLALSGHGAFAQAARTLKIVVPYTPASGPDILSRLMAEQIGRTQGLTVVVENRPGGGTIIGTEAAARAAPDGNTVLLVANSFVVNPALKKGNYDPLTGFEPVCQLAVTPMVLVVKADSPYRTVADLIAAARAKPGELSLASGGPASSLHFAFEVLKRAANINMTYVPYGGTAPSVNALMGGHVTAVFADYPTVVAALKSGTLRGLLTSSAARSEALPDVPTFAEAGLNKYEADIFYGIVAPAKTPANALAQLTGWFTAGMQAGEVKPRLAQQGLFPAIKCGADFTAILRGLLDDYSRVASEANIK
jgi:tripartite-type tricarboxylate transporter receptor subunit TctC